MSLKAQKGFLKTLATRLKGNSSSSSASYATAATDGHAKSGSSSVLKGEFFPVYVAIGMITLSAAFGIHTARHQLSRSPNVYVKKSRRETVPEVVEPEQVVEDAHNFINKSFFRKVAHVQDVDRQEVMPDPIRGDVFVRYIYTYLCIKS